MTIPPSPEQPKKYHCKSCGYSTSYKGNFNKHESSKKHKIATNIITKQISQICVCGKEYSCRQNLYRHKKNCNHLQFGKAADTSSDVDAFMNTMTDIQQEQRKTDKRRNIEIINTNSVDIHSGVGVLVNTMMDIQQEQRETDKRRNMEVMNTMFQLQMDQIKTLISMHRKEYASTARHDNVKQTR